MQRLDWLIQLQCCLATACQDINTNCIGSKLESSQGVHMQSSRTCDNPVNSSAGVA